MRACVRHEEQQVSHIMLMQALSLSVSVCTETHSYSRRTRTQQHGHDDCEFRITAHTLLLHIIYESNENVNVRTAVVILMVYSIFRDKADDFATMHRAKTSRLAS